MSTSTEEVVKEVVTKKTENTSDSSSEKPTVAEKLIEKKSDGKVGKVEDKKSVKSDVKAEDKPVASVDKQVDKQTVVGGKLEELKDIVDKEKVDSKSHKTVETVEGEIYTVEALLKSRARKNKGIEHKEYLVKWKGYSSRFNTWEPAENILDTKLIEAFDELEKNKPPKTPRQMKNKPEETTSITKQTKPTGRKPPKNRESIVPTPTRRSRRTTKSSDDIKDETESNDTDRQVEEETAQDEQIKSVDNQKIQVKTPEKLVTNSQDKTTIEKVVSLSDKLLTPEKEKVTDEKSEHQTNGQNGKLSTDKEQLLIDEKLDNCLNGDADVKRKSTEVDSIEEPSKKQLKTSDDSLATKESNGIQNNTPSLVN